MITMRPAARVGDVADPFIYDAWTRSLYASMTCEEIDVTSFLAARLAPFGPGCLRPYVQHVLEGAHVFIAHAVDDPQLLLGFVCADQERVHYIYVKKSLRRRGLAKQLLQHAQAELGPFHTSGTLPRGWMRGWAQRLGLTYDPVIERQST